MQIELKDYEKRILILALHKLQDFFNNDSNIQFAKDNIEGWSTTIESQLCSIEEILEKLRENLSLSPKQYRKKE